MMKKISFALLSMLVLSACETGEVKPDTIKVYKSDSSISCDQNSGTSIDVMMAELMQQKIPVVSMFCGSDSLVRAAVCGIETGQVNVFEISAGHFTKAKALGFDDLSKLEDFAETPCPNPS